MTHPNHVKPLTVSQVVGTFKHGNAFTRDLDAKVHVLFESERTWRWLERELTEPIEAANLPKSPDEADG